MVDVSFADPAPAHAVAPDLQPEGSAVLVVDADPIVRAGFSAVLGAEPWVSRCVAAAGLDEALGELDHASFDVVLVGLFLEDQHGVEICQRLRGHDPGLRVMLVTEAAGLPIRAARAAGACGLMHRGWSIDAILDAIWRAADGQLAFPGPSARPAGACRLSRRERAVLGLLARGASNVEIAGVLHLSPHTIKEYTQAVFRKLGVRNRVEAATAAARLGYAD